MGHPTAELYCIQMWRDQHGDRDRLCERLSEIKTHLTIPGNLRNSNHAMEGLRLIEGVLDSIHNSSDVYIFWGRF